jgi:putative DNA primase/helicase
MSDTDTFRPCPMPRHGADVPGCVCTEFHPPQLENEGIGWDGIANLAQLQFDLSVFRSQHDNVPKHRRYTWAELVAKLTPETPPVIPNGRDRPAWSPASYPPDVLRRNATVRSVSLLVGDVDDGTDPEHVLNTLFPGYACLVHTSWSHQREKKGITCARSRFAVPLASPVPPDEWERVWRGLQHLTKHVGIAIDPAVDSPSEIYFLPCLRDAAQPWWFGHRDGAVFDWHTLPEAPAAAKPKPSIVGDLFSHRGPGSGSGATPEARIAGFTRGKCDEIARAESRHEALLRASKWIAGLCARYTVDPAPFAAQLLDAAGDSNDAERTCRDGFEYGRNEPCDFPPDRPMPGRTISSGNGQSAPPDEPLVDLSILSWLPHTDLGNAKRLDARHGADLRWSAVRESWIVWVGTHWEWDEHELPHRWAQDTVERIGEEIGHLQSALTALGPFQEGEPEATTRRRESLEARVKSARKHAVTSQMSPRIKAASTEAKALPGRAVSMDDLDTEPWLLNTLSGTIDLRTGACRPHQRTDLITRVAPVQYDPDATCPRFLRFVESVFPNADVRSFVQRAVGYSLTGDVREQVWFVLKGEGSNGKSTFIDVIHLLLGQYATTVPRTVLEQQPYDRHEAELVDLKGARFASGNEPRKGKRWDAERIKQMSGNDRIKARGMRENFFEFDPSHKLWVACNDAPSTDDTSHGFWRRLVVIPFVVRFRKPEEPEDDRPLADLDLAAVLERELPGILNWALAGLADWMQHGLRIPPACLLAAREYRKEQDEVQRFVADCCDLVPGVSVRGSVLFAAFRQWRDAQGLSGRMLSSVQFGKGLTDAGILQFDGAGRVSMRSGIRLKPDEVLENNEDPGYSE